MESLEHLADKYEILGKLGEGGMGTVYKVRHRLLDELRVVKMMRAALRDDKDLSDRFQREAKVAIQLRHLQIAQLFDFTIDEQGNAFIVMEYIAGLTLEELLKAEPPSLALSLEIAVQALQAVDYLHRRNFVHRDISPDNLMLTHDDDDRPFVKLIDLGIAKAIEGEAARFTATGYYLGKVRYSSPEQLEGAGVGQVDVRSDLYSFAVVLYELVTGRYPISGHSGPSWIAGHLYRPPLSFDQSDPQERVPAALRELLLEALAKDPEDRPANAEEFSRRLDKLRSACPMSEEIRLRTLDLIRSRAEGAGSFRGASNVEDPPQSDGHWVTTPASWLVPQTSEQTGTKSLPTSPPPGTPARGSPLEETADLERQQRKHRRQEAAGRSEKLLARGELDTAASQLQEIREELGDGSELQELRARLEELQEQRRRAEQTVGVERPPGADEKTVSLDVDKTVRVSPPGEVAPVAQSAQAAITGPAIRESVQRRRVAVAAAMFVLLVVAGGTASWWLRPLVVKPTGIVETTRVSQPVTGRLIINAIPWGRLSAVVDQDGQPHPEVVGAYTPVAVDLPPGRYKIRLENDGFDGPRELDVEVRPRETARCLGQFTEVSIDEFFEQLGW